VLFALLAGSGMRVGEGLGLRVEPLTDDFSTNKYSEQLKTDVEWRKEVAEYTGLGFKPPTVESSVGLLGLPKSTKTEKIGVEESRLTD